jgi:hypothetical protein
MSEQPTLDALQQRRIWEAACEWIALGRAFKKLEAMGQIPPDVADAVNLGAEKWRGE